MKKFYLMLVLSIFSFASNLSQEAFNAYKNKNYKKAYMLWDTLCKKGNIKACNNEAMLIYLKAIKLNENQAKAISVLKNLLKKDPSNTTIMYNLGIMYYNGYFDRVKQKVYLKRKDAFKLFGKCAKLGDKRCKLEYNAIKKQLNDKKK